MQGPHPPACLPPAACWLSFALLACRNPTHLPAPPAADLFPSACKESAFSFTGVLDSPPSLCYHVRFRDGKVSLLSVNTHGFSFSSYFTQLLFNICVCAHVTFDLTLSV